MQQYAFRVTLIVMLKRHSCFGNKKIPAHGLFVHNKNKKDETEVVEISVYQAHVKSCRTYVAKHN